MATLTTRVSSHGSSPLSDDGSPLGDGSPRGAEARLRNEPLRCLVGPTAAGKSRLALALAERYGVEIVSLDSMQVYARMDIGTAKPGVEERARVPHHMLDLVQPWERYDVQRYLRDLEPVQGDLDRRGRRALFVGGTGFYLMALTAGLFEGPPVDIELRRRIEARTREEGNPALHRELARIDPACAARIHVNDTKRLVRALEVYEQTGRPLSHWQKEWSSFALSGARGPSRRPRRIAGLDLAVSELDRRIGERTRAMLAAGWVEEALGIRALGGFGPSAIQALGYRDVLDLADGRVDRETCAARIALATRQFARRQRTWYRKFPDIAWFPAPEGPRATRAPADDSVPDVARALGLEGPV